MKSFFAWFNNLHPVWIAICKSPKMLWCDVGWVFRILIQNISGGMPVTAWKSRLLLA